MITPPANRIATTVVPCGISRVDGPVTPAPGSWCGASLRSTSANDGPGSTDVENSGSELDSDIGAGAYRPISTPQGTNPLPHKQCQLLVAVEIVGRLLENLVVFLKAPDRLIASKAKQATNHAGRVIMIDVERPLVRPRLPADRAHAALLVEHPVVVGKSDAELAPQVPFSIGRFAIRALPILATIRVEALWIRLLPLLHAVDVRLRILGVLGRTSSQVARFAVWPEPVLARGVRVELSS